MASNGKRRGKHSMELPPVDREQPRGVRPAFTPSEGNKRAKTDNPYINAGRHLSSFDEHSRNSSRYTAQKKSRKGFNAAVAVLLVLVVVLAGAGIAVASYVSQLNRQISNQDQEQAEAIDAVLKPVTATEGADVSDEPFYMMLIGSDTRHDEFGQRSDTNIVVRVDPGNAVVTMISIPRDTAINLEGYGTVKFNAAYNYYGTAGTIQAASDLLGVDISHYAEIDFEGLIKLIDSVGGVDVDVPMRIEDADAGELVIEAGQQTLNGEQALVFARSRSYTTADFQRTTNQRLLVEAFVNKVMSMPATELPGLVQTAAGAVTTDLTVSEIIGYATKFKNADEVTMYSALMPLTEAKLDGEDYVICDTETLATMMAVVNEGGDPGTVTSDFTVTSSAEAEEQGAYSIPVYVPTDDTNGDTYEDEYYDEEYYGEEYTEYYDPNVYYDDSYGYSDQTYVDTGGGEVYYDTGETYVDAGGEMM